MKHVFKILREGNELWRQYVLIGFLNVSLSLMSVAMPILSGWAVDEMRKGSQADIRYMLILAFGIFLLDLFPTFISNINGYIGDQVSARLNKILSEKYYAKLLSLPQSYFDSELTGKIINRLSRSIVQITNFIQMMSNNFLQFIFSTAIGLLVIAHYSLEIAILLFALYPIFVLMTVKSSGKWQAYQKKKNEHNDIALGRFNEAVGQIKVVKSYVQENHEKSFFAQHFTEILNINKPQSKHWHVQDIRRRLILNVIFFGVFAFIFYKGAKGYITPGAAVTLILQAMNIRIPIFTISWLVENTQRAVADSKDYFDVMSIKPSIKDEPKAMDLKVNKGMVEFRQVEFSYDGTNRVLKGISLDIKPNTKVALVGESGEGKTTITNLLLRLYDVSGGSISIDKQDISKVTQSSLRENIGVVFQDPSLFSGTIRENIAYANPKATDNEIKKAARAANAHEFIEKFKEGYDTEIGERGLKLSGGQKQRIAIARALLKDAPILILDEATSSLDSKSERLVHEALERLMANRTTIIIAHRLSTIQKVNTIVTIKNGQIDEIGSPKQLSRTGGIYAQLLSLQSKSESDLKQLKKFDLES
ncbi:ABC transporter ATP-binding protein [Candidatus Saccharibacteria bacterium]|nr:ABC transporter ATP-binding protein [Candidatus Saccharibacteria bacterium]